jgi:hypothetical protein
MKSLKPKSFRPATIGITAPALDKMGKDSPAAKATRRAGRAGVVGRKLRVSSGKRY